MHAQPSSTMPSLATLALVTFLAIQQATHIGGEGVYAQGANTNYYCCDGDSNKDDENVRVEVGETPLEMLQALDEINYTNDSVLAMKATSVPDTMYYHKAMRQVDKKRFIATKDLELKSLAESRTYTI